MGVISQNRALRVIRFLTVGGTVAAIDFSLVWLLHFFLRPLVAVSIAYLTGVTCHFLLNKFWVFRCRRSDYGKQLVQYGLNVFCCWLVTLAIVRLCLNTFTNNILVAKLCAIPPATLLGFLGLQLMVFRRTAPRQKKKFGVRSSEFGLRGSEAVYGQRNGSKSP
jgi:putative flippase GtrA